MSSIVINVPSGYINAFLFLLTEIIVINLIVTSIRKRLDAYNTYKSLAKGNRISLRQVNILGIETRRDRYSLIMLSLTLLTIISLSIMEWGVNGETTMKTAMYEGIVIGGDSMIGYSKNDSNIDDAKNWSTSPITKVRTFAGPSIVCFGKYLEIRQKCSKINYYSNSKNYLNFSMELQSAAIQKSVEDVHKQLNHRGNDHLKAVKMHFDIYNSHISCIGRKITVKHKHLDNKCIESHYSLPRNENSPLWKRIHFYSHKDTQSYSNDFVKFYLKNVESVDKKSCLRDSGYRNRYQVRVSCNNETDNDFGDKAWNIYTFEGRNEYKYLILQDRGHDLPRQERYQTIEISSPIPIGHLVFRAMEQPSCSRVPFQQSLAHHFYSNSSYTSGYDYEYYEDIKDEIIPINLFGENGTYITPTFRTLPFQVETQGTRIERWTLIAFGSLLLFLILLCLYCETVWRGLPVKANAMSAEWLGTELIRECASRTDSIVDEYNPCVELVQTKHGAQIIHVLNDDKNSG